MPKLKPLLPCPFCGCLDIRILPQADGWKTVGCTSCNATIRVYTSLKRQVVAAWNMRRTPDLSGERTTGGGGDFVADWSSDSEVQDG